ncbi:MAG TPA: L-serine ammonia-lyase, iron-sulfur-dependent, subunit alpha [Candidatus Avimonas sp.]|nr:L-serine ammonia-lyase, iron-sulfur-dependent, subunit alpha [Candidatus Avimonas sp.]HQD38737.1 L-serine ammonia-lyase, iron-sulfur-dependent, subunit alpha [Candidatus Avimonas sp.]
MKELNSVADLIREANRLQCGISNIVINHQVATLGVSETALFEGMRSRYQIMRDAIRGGLQTARSVSGLSGGQAKRYRQNASKIGLLSGTAEHAMEAALAISEYNAAMGLVVAAPTAGSCGILPAVLFAVGQAYDLPEEHLIRALFNSAGIGAVIAARASLSGAEGGCQAECGSAAAMAASAVAELLGGTPEKCGDACALSLKFTMGLVCDPVAGLVEVPCVKRNAFGAVTALTAAELALCGISSAIPADEVIDAMKAVGDQMVPALKETSRGGLAATKTARGIEKRIKRI